MYQEVFQIENHQCRRKMTSVEDPIKVPAVGIFCHKLWLKTFLNGSPRGTDTPGDLFASCKTVVETTCIPFLLFIIISTTQLCLF